MIGFTIPSVESLLGSLNLLQLGFLGIIIVILLLFSVRLTLAMHGTRYTTFRLAFVPILYTLFSLYLFYQTVGTNISILGTPYVLRSFVLLIPLGLAVGFVLGMAAGKNVKFYKKNGGEYFRKSLAVSLFWTLSFILEFIFVIYFPATNFNLLFTGILSIATGMLDGQAIRAHFMHRARSRDISGN
ncbi:MAG: hypothetical protein QW597_04950 [Thermoplasmataceae archaeon]